MMMNKKELVLPNDKIITFDYEIRQIIKVDDKQLNIVLLSIPFTDNTLDNIYAFSDSGEKKWQVQSQDNSYKKFPYEQMKLIENVLYATDFYGKRVHIDTNNGDLIGQDIVK